MAEVPRYYRTTTVRALVPPVPPAVPLCVAWHTHAHALVVLLVVGVRHTSAIAVYLKNDSYKS